MAALPGSAALYLGIVSSLYKLALAEPTGKPK
jgi:hypothetical protein